MAGRFETLTVDGMDMSAYVAGPDKARPGVLVCIHAPGVDPFIQDICVRLEAAGFTAVAPDLYHRHDIDGRGPMERMALLRDDQILRDFDATKAYLNECSNGKHLVVGFCMGGRLAYLWAAHDSDVRAAAVFYGGNIMVPWGEDNPAPFERTAEIDCPLLGLFGNEDENPSPADVDRIAEELDLHEKSYTFHRYDEAGHAFLNAMRPSHRPRQAEEAWDKCLAFLREHAG